MKKSWKSLLYTNYSAQFFLILKENCFFKSTCANYGSIFSLYS